MSQNTAWQSSSLWDACLARVRDHVTASAYTAWFSSLQLARHEGDTVVLLARNALIRDFVAQHHRPLLEKALADELGGHIRVVLEVAPQSAETLAAQAAAPAAPVRMAPPEHRETPRNESARREASRLHPRLTFENFVEGECNRVALAACNQVAKQPGRSIANPLVLVGGTGLGKTHLLQAVGNLAWQQETAKKVLYRTSEEFSREFLEYVVFQRKTKSFHELYRDADIVLIDDIQFFGGRVNKERFRAEMVNLLAMLQSQNKQVVLSCDQMPSEVQHFDKQLLSRIETGLLVDLTAPDHDTRQAILRRKAIDGGWNITDDVLDHIADAFTGNVRQLEGALLKLCAFSDLCGGRVDREAAQAILGDTVRNRTRTVSIASITQAVAEAMGVDASLLCSRTRKKQIATARHLAMLLCNELTDNTLHTIGVHFGRDYSTVHHSLGAAKELLVEDSHAQAVYASIRERLSPSH
ncbi:MAG: hypothetical protein RL318_1738 [Fibrobacterota bacterium]|jgi:chromosomal replication initiator protein